MVAAEVVASWAAPGTTIFGLPLSQGLAIVLMFPVYRLVLDRMVADLTMKHWELRPESSVWWPITWRNFEANSLAVVLGHVVHQTADPWLGTQPLWLAFVVTLGLAIATIVAMLTVWGWIAGRVLGRTPPFDDPPRMAALSR